VKNVVNPPAAEQQGVSGRKLADARGGAGTLREEGLLEQAAQLQLEGLDLLLRLDALVLRVLVLLRQAAQKRIN
jgi:hypothetical protein